MEQCPQCLSSHGARAAVLECGQGHRYVAVAVADGDGVSPIWLAVQLLEDESARLRYVADRGGDEAQGQLARAAALDEAADLLRRQPQSARTAGGAGAATGHGVGGAGGGAGGGPPPEPLPGALPSHLEVVPHGDGGVALRCTVCGQTCTVPEDLSTRDVLQPFLQPHPDHRGGCPEWGTG